MASLTGRGVQVRVRGEHGLDVTYDHGGVLDGHGAGTRSGHLTTQHSAVTTERFITTPDHTSTRD